MQIQKITSAGTNYTGKLLTNKRILKCLEKISEHSTSFSAGTSLLLSLTLRPISIFSTPDTEKENKQYAAANSICSGLIKFGMVEAVALPIEYAVKKIDKNPEKFLNPETLKKHPINSKSYKLMTQILKLSTGFITAIPKSMLTLALIPIIMDNLFFKHKNSKEEKLPDIKQQNINFTGRISDKIAKNLGKIINNKQFQNFAKKHENKDKDIAKHITAGTDILLTTSFAYQTNKSKKIKENRKKALIYNNIIGTAITLLGGYGIDNLAKNKTNKFIEKFKKLNAGNTKLPKYIEGINILRPAIIFAGIYYGILPIISTYTAEKVDKFIEKRNKNN